MERRHTRYATRRVVAAQLCVIPNGPNEGAVASAQGSCTDAAPKVSEELCVYVCVSVSVCPVSVCVKEGAAKGAEWAVAYCNTRGKQ